MCDVVPHQVLYLGSADDDGPAVRKAEMMGPDSRLQVNPTCRLPNTRYSTPTIMETCTAALL